MGARRSTRREFAASLAAVLPEAGFAVFNGEDHAGAATAGTGRAVSFAFTARAPFAV